MLSYYGWGRTLETQIPSLYHLHWDPLSLINHLDHVLIPSTQSFCCPTYWNQVNISHLHWLVYLLKLMKKLIFKAWSPLYFQDSVTSRDPRVKLRWCSWALPTSLVMESFGRTWSWLCLHRIVTRDLWSQPRYGIGMTA